MQIKKEQLELDKEQHTGSKSGKEYVRAIYCHLDYLTYVQSTSWEMLDWMKQKLESRLPGEISVPPSSVQFSHSVVPDSLWPHEPQHARPPCPSSTPGVHPNPCPSSRWCHPTISSSVVPFYSCPQAFPASGSYQVSQFFTSGAQIIGFSFNISLTNEHPGLISFKMDWLDLLQSKGLSRVFSNTIVQKYQFFGAQPSL